jgi:hypothetical protein
MDIIMDIIYVKDRKYRKYIRFAKMPRISILVNTSMISRMTTISITSWAEQSHTRDFL